MQPCSKGRDMKRQIALGVACAMLLASTAVEAQLGGLIKKKAGEVLTKKPEAPPAPAPAPVSNGRDDTGPRHASSLANSGACTGGNRQPRRGPGRAEEGGLGSRDQRVAIASGGQSSSPRPSQRAVQW